MTADTGGQPAVTGPTYLPVVWSRRGSVLCGISLAAVGAVVLLAWVSQNYALASWTACCALGFWAALAFVLAGVALAILAANPDPASVLVRICAGLVGLIVLMHFVGWAIGQPLRSDLLGLAPMPPPPGHPLPGAMSTTVALCLAAACLCMLLSRPDVRIWIAAIALLTTLLGIANVLGHAYGRPLLYQPHSLPTSLPGAVGLSLLGLGLLLHASAYEFAIRRQAESERNRLHRELTAQRDLMQSMVEHAPAGLALFNGRTGTIMWHNRAYAELLDERWHQRSLVGLPLGEIVPDAEAAGINALHNAVATGATYRFPEFEFAGFARGMTYFNWSLSPVPGPDGDGFDILSMAVDVTEQVLALQQTRRLTDESQRRAAELDTIINSIADGVMIYDAEGYLLRANPAVNTVLQYTEVERALPLAERLKLLNPHDTSGRPIPIDDAPTSRALRGQSFHGVTITTYPGTDREATCLYGGAPIRDAAGNITGAVVTVTDVTALQALQERAEDLAAEEWRRADELDAIINSIADGVVVYNADGTVRRLNEAALVSQHLRETDPAIPLAERRGMVVRDEQDQPLPIERLPSIRALAGETVHFQVTHVQQLDGTWNWFATSAAPLHNRSGEITGAVSTFRDITESRQAQDELQRHRDHLEELVQARTAEVQERSRILESVFQNSLSALVLLDTSFNFVRVNDTYARGCARPVSAFPGRNHFVEYPSDELKAVFEEVVRSGKPWSDSARPFEFPDHPEWGTTYWDLSVVPILGTQGQVELLLFSLQDVTERKRAEQTVAQRTAELVESERQYRELVESAKSAIIRYSSDGTITLANEYAEQLFGYERGELLGKHVMVLVPPTDELGRSLEGLKDAVISDPVAYETSENENVTKDGRRLWVVWANRPVYGKDGSLEGILTTGIDRTAQHETQKQLRAHQEALRKVAAELALAEQRERQRISALLHDEVAQPLGATKLRLSMLRGKHPSAAQDLAELIELTNEAIRHSRNIMTELSPPVLHRLGLIQATRWWAGIVEERYQLKIAVDAPEDRLQLDKMVETAIFQALKEIIRNVVKHAQASAVNVTFECGDSGLHISVSDNGVGFDHRQTQPTEEGGFGLVSIHERIGYLGGSMDVSSEPGHGTQVTLSLPGVVKDSAPDCRPEDADAWLIGPK